MDNIRDEIVYRSGFNKKNIKIEIKNKICISYKSILLRVFLFCITTVLERILQLSALIHIFEK